MRGQLSFLPDDVWLTSKFLELCIRSLEQDLDTVQRRNSRLRLRAEVQVRNNALRRLDSPRNLLHLRLRRY
jgi:hypothetical protein